MQKTAFYVAICGLSPCVLPPFTKRTAVTDTAKSHNTYSERRKNTTPKHLFKNHLNNACAAEKNENPSETRLGRLFQEVAAPSWHSPPDLPTTVYKCLFYKYLHFCKRGYYIMITRTCVKYRIADIYGLIANVRQKHLFACLDNFYEICKRLAIEA